VVKVFEVGYAGPELGRAARSEADARRMAASAVHHLGRGVPLAEVASAYGDRADGGGVVRDQALVRVKTPSALQEAAFSLPPGGATYVPVPAFGYLVVYRPR
jgi:hypothetical protein